MALAALGSCAISIPHRLVPETKPHPRLGDWDHFRGFRHRLEISPSFPRASSRCGSDAHHRRSPDTSPPYVNLDLSVEHSETYQSVNKSKFPSFIFTRVWQEGGVRSAVYCSKDIRCTASRNLLHPDYVSLLGCRLPERQPHAFHASVSSSQSNMRAKASLLAPTWQCGPAPSADVKRTSVLRQVRWS